MDILVHFVTGDPAKAAEEGVWAGGEAPVEEKSAAQKKLDKDFIECAFDGEMDEVKRLLEEGEYYDYMTTTCFFKGDEKG